MGTCMDNGDGLERLRELTKQLPSFSDKVEFKNDYIELDAGEGTVIEFAIYRGKCCSVDRWFMSRGAILGRHTQSYNRWILVCEGELRVALNGGGEQILDTGEAILLQSKNEHGPIMALEDTWVLNVMWSEGVFCGG